MFSLIFFIIMAIFPIYSIFAARREPNKPALHYAYNLPKEERKKVIAKTDVKALNKFMIKRFSIPLLILTFFGALNAIFRLLEVTEELQSASGWAFMIAALFTLISTLSAMPKLVGGYFETKN